VAPPKSAWKQSQRLF